MPPCRALDSANLLIQLANPESQTIDMMQGPDNDRPEPYVSPHAPDRPGATPRPATGPAVGPAPAAASKPTPGAGHAQDGPRPTAQPEWGAAPAGGTPPPAGPGARAGGAAAPGPAGGVGQAGAAQAVPRQAGAADPAELEALVAELAAAEARAAANHEQLLRAVAETENVRRRSQDEILKARKFANESFAESLLPVIDSLELALKVDAPTLESLREGVEATLRLMVSAFEKNRLIGIDPAGEKFDPNHHQAISMVPSDATDPPTPANHVATVLQKGYLINDRVLRPALVTVVQG